VGAWDVGIVSTSSSHAWHPFHPAFAFLPSNLLFQKEISCTPVDFQTILNELERAQFIISQRTTLLLQFIVFLKY
jgi:hypothetical protein